MKRTFIWILATLFVTQKSDAQCNFLYFDSRDENSLWWCSQYGGYFMDWFDQEPGWTYSWSPATYLDNANIAWPTATFPPGVTITYTLTVDPPNCAPFPAGYVTFVVPPSSVSVSPSGPINYFYQHEGSPQLTLTSSDSRVFWFKNNDDNQIGFNTSTINVTISGGSGTDTYYAGTGCYVNSGNPVNRSNIVSISRIACDDPTDYPVGLPSYGCASSLTSPNYIQLNAPSLGSGTSYSYWMYHNPSNYSITNTGHLTGISPWGSDGIYVKSSRNGSETYMFYTIDAMGWCRTGGNDKANSDSAKLLNRTNVLIPIISNTQLSPNPANSSVTASSKSLIKRIEVYNILGIRVHEMSINNVHSVYMNTTAMKVGIYTVKIVTDQGIETMKLVIQR